MNEIRILVLSSMYPKGINSISGIFIHHQVKALQKEGCKVKVISPVPYIPQILCFNSKWKKYKQIPKYINYDGIPVYYPRYFRLPGKWFWSISCYTMNYGIRKFVDSIIREFAPDIFQVYTATLDGYAGLMLRKKYNIPLICSFRGDDINICPKYDQFTHYLTKKVIVESDQITTVSNSLKIVAERIGKPKKEIQVVYNGCDSKMFSYNTKGRLVIRKKLRISSKKLVIIFVGDLAKYKGIFELLSAFTKLNYKYSNLYLILIGKIPDRTALDKIVSSNYLNNKIYIVGEIPQNEIPYWLSASDIFVFPTYNEGLPNAVMEAMACSLPIIATKVGGIPEVVRDGQNGILIDKKSVISIEHSIEKLINNKNMCKKMGEYGRTIIEEKFTWNNSAKKLIGIYNSIINKT